MTSHNNEKPKIPLWDRVINFFAEYAKPQRVRQTTQEIDLRCSDLAELRQREDKATQSASKSKGSPPRIQTAFEAAVVAH